MEAILRGQAIWRGCCLIWNQEKHNLLLHEILLMLTWKTIVRSVRYFQDEARQDSTLLDPTLADKIIGPLLFESLVFLLVFPRFCLGCWPSHMYLKCFIPIQYKEVHRSHFSFSKGRMFEVGARWKLDHLSQSFFSCSLLDYADYMISSRVLRSLLFAWSHINHRRSRSI